MKTYQVASELNTAQRKEHIILMFTIFSHVSCLCLVDFCLPGTGNNFKFKSSNKKFFNLHSHLRNKRASQIGYFTE